MASDTILSMEISKKLYIKGEYALDRLKNLEKLALEHYKGNFTEMVNDVLNRHFHLDPATGERLKTRAKA